MKKALLFVFCLVVMLSMGAYAMAAEVSLSSDTMLTVQIDGENANFASADSTFSKQLAYGPEQVSVYLRANNRYAVITAINGKTLAEPDRVYRFEQDVPLENGAALSIRVTVRAEDGSQKTYIIELSRPRSLSLDKLIVSRSSSASSTDYDVVQVDEGVYAVTVAAAEETVYIRPVAKEEGADITLEPVDYGYGLDQVGDGVFAFDIAEELAQGEARTFRITFSCGEYDTLEFDISITRGVAGSDDATLAGMIFRSSYSTESTANILYYSPAFSPDITSYRLYIPDGVRNITVWPDPAAADNLVTVTVNGATWLGGNSYKDISLKNIDNIEISVLAQNLLDRLTYNFEIIRVADDAGSVASLADISLRSSNDSFVSLPLSPSFNSSTYTYTATVSTTQSKIFVYPQLDSSAADAMVFVNGSATSIYQTVSLNSGANIIKVDVISADFLNKKSYTITVYRGSGVAGLSSISLRSGQGGAISFSPQFSPDCYAYTANVFNSSSAVYFAPTANSAGSVIHLANKNSVYPLTNDAWSNGFVLDEGVNNFTITIISAGGAEQSYSFAIYRRPDYLSCKVSEQGLSVNGMAVNCAAYNINGNNFFKLRDIAQLLSGTAAQVGVSYNNTTRVINLVSGMSYSPIGGELVKPIAYESLSSGNQPVYLDGEPIFPMAYNIDGNNYFLLRDLAVLLDFTVSYDEVSRTMKISVLP